MHEIEKWLKELIEKKVIHDRDSIRKFIRRELRNNPLEDSETASYIISAIIDSCYMSGDIALMEEMNYRKELREKK